MAKRILTYCITFGAGSDFAMLDRAANLALGFVAFNLAFGASEFLTSCGALGRLAHGLTNLITHGFITLPLALGMAIVSISAVSARIGAAACSKSALFLFSRWLTSYSVKKKMNKLEKAKK